MMNSELQKLIDTQRKYNAPYWIIYKGKEKEEYFEGDDLETSISELEESFNNLNNGEYIFKAREGKNAYNSQLVRRFSKGILNNNLQNLNSMDSQTMFLLTQTLSKIELRQEQMNNDLQTVVKAVQLLTDSDKSNDKSGLEMLETISKGAKVVGSLKDMFKTT